MKVNAPLVDQRRQVGNDGQAPEDGPEDCVAAAFSSLIRAFWPASGITADGLHDIAYGQGYIGLQDPARYAGIAGRFGVAMTYLAGSAQYLVNAAVAAIRAGHGVLLTIPSDWGDNPPTSRYAHTVAGCDTDGASITCMNSWTVAYEKYSLAWWAVRLARCSYQGIWIVQKVGTQSVWTRAADGSAQDSATPQRHAVGAGIADAIFAHGLQGTNGLTSEEYYAAGKSFAALDDGTVVSWDGSAHVDQAAQVLAAVWGQLQDAKKNPPVDPIATKALSWAAAGKTLFGEL